MVGREEGGWEGRREGKERVEGGRRKEGGWEEGEWEGGRRKEGGWEEGRGIEGRKTEEKEERKRVSGRS